MDYKVIQNFRDALNAFTSFARDEETTALRGNTLSKIAEKLESVHIVHELQHVPNLINRFQLVRYLPSSHRIPVLHSTLLHPNFSISKLKSSNSRHHQQQCNLLMAHLNSLILDWTSTTNPSSSTTSMIEPLLHSLRAHYADLTGTTQEKYIHLPEQLCTLVTQGRLRLKAVRDTVALMSVDEALDVVEEDICAQWAQLRGIITQIVPTLLLRAKKLHLDIDVDRANTLIKECEDVFRLLRNRDVDVPTVQTPLGEGTMSRLPAFLPVENSDGSESDEWEDVVELSNTGQDEQRSYEEEKEEEEEEKEDNDNDNEIEFGGLLKIGSNTPFKNNEHGSNGCLNKPTVKTDDSIHEQFGLNLKRDAKASSAHNNSILNVIEARANPNASQTKRGGHEGGVKRNKEESMGVRDRLRKKLGIRKGKKQRRLSP